MKEQIMGIISLIVLISGTSIYILKTKGKEELIKFIMKAEYIFDWEGAGKEKLNYVLKSVQEKMPLMLRVFVNVDVINRLVEVLQKDFLEMHKDKE